MAGYEVVERVRDGQAPVEALVVEVTLTGLRELAHDAEVLLLVRCQIPGSPEKCHDIGSSGRFSQSNSSKRPTASSGSRTASDGMTARILAEMDRAGATSMCPTFFRASPSGARMYICGDANRMGTWRPGLASAAARSAPGRPQGHGDSGTT